MTTNFRRMILATAAAVAMCVAHGETLTWQRYNLTFEVPDGGYVTHRTSTSYELQWHDLTFSIRLFDKSGADDNFLKYNLQKSASGYNMYDTQLHKSKIDGFKGYNLTGTLPDGSRACLTNVVSKKSNLAIMIEINYYLGDEARVDAILKSFAEGKKKEKAAKQKIQKKGSKPKPIKPGKVADETPTPLYEI
ncbi:MAG: hypothetical protein ACI4UW_04505 [Muribaculaceae bacterium]